MRITLRRHAVPGSAMWYFAVVSLVRPSCDFRKKPRHVHHPILSSETPEKIISGTIDYLVIDNIGVRTGPPMAVIYAKLSRTARLFNELRNLA